MANELLKTETNRIKRIMKLIGLRRDVCLDNIEVMIKFHEIERRLGRYFWMMSKREYSFNNKLIVFVKLMDEVGNQFLVRVSFNVGYFSFEIPESEMDMFNETTGITVMRIGDYIQITGKILCVESVGIRYIN